MFFSPLNFYKGTHKKDFTRSSTCFWYFERFSVVLASNLNTNTGWVFEALTSPQPCSNWTRTPSISLIGYFPFKEFFTFPQSIKHLNFNSEIILTIGLILFLELFQKLEGYSDMKFLFKNQPAFFRWSVYFLLVLSIIFLSENVGTKFIYFQF